MIAAMAVVLALAWQGVSPGQAALDRANAQFSARKLQECMNSLDEALKLDPRLVPALLLKARLAMAVKRHDVARESLEKALAVKPDSAAAHFLYGFNFYEQNELPAAIEALQKARRLDTADPRAALYLGLSKESLGATTEALSLYQEAIRLERAAGRRQASTLLISFRLQLVLGLMEDADRTILEALRLAPASKDVHFEQARLWMKRGQPEAAVKAGKQALRLKGEEIQDSQVHFLLIRAYQSLGKEVEAARHAEAVRQLERQ